MPKKRQSGRPGTDREKAKKLLLAFPNRKDEDLAKEIGSSSRTVARARAELVKSGGIPSHRGPTGGTTGSFPDSTPPTYTPPASKDSLPYRTVPFATLPGLSGPFIPPDDTEIEEMDGDTRRKFLKALRIAAFDMNLSPDTRFTAMQLYLKIKDAIRAKELGPGVPLTHETALSRLVLLFSAVGIELVNEAHLLAFSPKESPNAPDAPTVGVSNAESTSDETPREPGSTSSVCESPKHSLREDTCPSGLAGTVPTDEHSD
jgi:hypothetical protein